MSHTIDAANGKVYKAKEGRHVRIIIRHPCLAQIIIRHPCLAHIKIFSTTNLRFQEKLRTNMMEKNEEKRMNQNNKCLRVWIE
jgi:hypothetical protein